VQQVLSAAARSRAPAVSTRLQSSLAATPTDRGGRGQVPAGLGGRRLSRSLQRGLSLLAYFARDGGEHGIVELAAKVGMSPSTAHRYALTLVQLGLLERCPDTRKYRLPPS
jgi:hypothetical protein